MLKAVLCPFFDRETAFWPDHCEIVQITVIDFMVWNGFNIMFIWMEALVLGQQMLKVFKSYQGNYLAKGT